MPPRALVLITALVLALHWLVLSGVPLAWDSPAQPSGRVFSTRSIAAAPPTVAAAEAAAAPVAVAPKPASPRPRLPARSKPKASPPDALTAPGESGDANIQPEAAVAVAVADGNATAPSDDTPIAPAKPASAPEAPASAPPSPSPPPASAPPTAEPATGVDITPPGAGTGQVPSATPPPVRLPPPTRLAFDVNGQAKKFSYQARAELLWLHDGSRYETRQELSAFLVGSRAQRSVGAVTAQGLLPERFSDRSRSEQAAHFDYTKGRVTFSANTPEAPIGPGAQDRLSVFIQLGALLAADPGRFVPGTQVTLTTVSARSADRWTFSVEAPETLDLPAGATPTLKLQRLPRKDYDQKAELWVAPALGYLPVRIRLTQANGDFADLQLRSSSAP